MKRQIRIDSSNFDGHFLPWRCPFDQIILQLGRIENLLVFDRQQDVVLLNADFFRLVCHILYGHAPLGSVLYRGHVNPHF
jgi:hypothetical protein